MGRMSEEFIRHREAMSMKQKIIQRIFTFMSNTGGFHEEIKK